MLDLLFASIMLDLLSRLIVMVEPRADQRHGQSDKLLLVITGASAIAGNIPVAFAELSIRSASGLGEKSSIPVIWRFAEKSEMIRRAPVPGSIGRVPVDLARKWFNYAF